MNESAFFNNKNVKQNQIRDVLFEAFQCIDDNNFEFNSSHKANTEFRVENDFSNDDLLYIFKQVTVSDFCHIEIDTKYPDERLYCFKLYFKYADVSEDDILSVIAEEEILVKFKFREHAGKKLFIMTIHYPDENKEPWTWIWKEN